MKAPSICIVLFQLLASTNADRMLRVLFNNGVAFADNCTAEDNVLIDDIFYGSGRRSVRSIGQEEHRARELYPAYCKNNCLGYRTGMCRATNCQGFRRRLATAPVISCTSQTRSVNNSLSALVTQNKVSTKCRNLLNRPRKFECYDDVIYGEVEYIRAIDSNNVTLSRPGVTLSICRSVRFRLEVGINTCVDKIHCDIRKDGLNFYNANLTATYPFNHFVDSWSLQRGFYIGTCMPDGFSNKSKSIQVDLREC